MSPIDTPATLAQLETCLTRQSGRGRFLSLLLWVADPDEVAAVVQMRTNSQLVLSLVDQYGVGSPGHRAITPPSLRDFLFDSFPVSGGQEIQLSAECFGGAPAEQTIG